LFFIEESYGHITELAATGQATGVHIENTPRSPDDTPLFVLRHRGILEQRLPDVEWVDLRALPAKPPVDPKNALPTLHFDWLSEEGGYDFIGTGFTPPVTRRCGSPAVTSPSSTARN
jgi:hypothetical protein